MYCKVYSINTTLKQTGEWKLRYGLVSGYRTLQGNKAKVLLVYNYLHLNSPEITVLSAEEEEEQEDVCVCVCV